MEALSTEPENNKLDPLQLLKTRHETRAGIPSLPNLERLYAREDLLDPSTQHQAREQVELICSHRAGDLIPAAYGLETAYEAKVDCFCCCGQPLQMRHRTLLNLLTGPGENTYYAPVGAHPAFPAPGTDQNLSRYCCPHIEQELAEAYPYHFEVWKNMKKQVQTRVRTYPSTAHRMVIETSWFHRVSGFAQFVLDLEVPDKEGQSIRKKDRAGNYSKAMYTWSNLKPSGSARSQYPELSRRYYALRSNARKLRRHFQWDNFTDFLDSINPPQDFNEDPSRWRLRWESPYSKGYTDANFAWERVGRKSENNASSQPWNDIAKAERLSQELPFEELGMTPAQYMEALVWLGLLIGDCNRTRDTIEGLWEEAAAYVKQG